MVCHLIVAHHYEVNMNWKRYFIGINHQKANLFIGTGDLKKDGTIKYTNRSDDRTYEIVNAVARLMRMKLNKGQKPWFGYDIPRAGKLVLIKPGYDFFVKRKSNDNTIKPSTDF